MLWNKYSKLSIRCIPLIEIKNHFTQIMSKMFNIQKQKIPTFCSCKPSIFARYKTNKMLPADQFHNYSLLQ